MKNLDEFDENIPLKPDAWNQFLNSLKNKNPLRNILITNLPELTPAVTKSPWIKLFGTVIKFDKLFRELFTPDLTGDGKVTFADILKGRGVKRRK